MNAARKKSLAQSATGPQRLCGPALLLSLPLLAAGLWLPSLHLENLWVLHQEYSLLTAALAFWEKGHIGLFLLISGFTIVFPLLKGALGLWLFYKRFDEDRRERFWLRRLGGLSKWSMLDVFVIAVLVLALEGSVLTTAQLGNGIACFTASVLLSGWAFGQLTEAIQARATEKEK